MNQYEYEIIPLKFKSILTGKIDLDQHEAALNQAASKGFRLKHISGISSNWNSYLEKKVAGADVVCQYKIFNSDYQSKIYGKISRASSSQFLTGLGMEGWQLKMVHTFNNHTYFFLEKEVEKE